MNKLVLHMQSLLRAVRPRPRGRESFEQLFNDFREVLDRNNRSLEIITDMGDTLGGDYLFDIQYVRRSYAGLSSAMEGSLASFDALTRNRYPRLHDRFLTIDGQIRRVIDETAPASDALVLFYENLRSDMAGDVGGKNNNLAAVKNTLQLNVPDAFAVTTRAFDAFLRHNHILEKARLPEDGTPISENHLHDLHEQVLYGTMPPELSRALEKAVKKIKSRCGTGCTLAVRSSAGEEDGDFSFAGQFETVLNVPLEVPAIEKAYRKVVASLFSEKSAVYQTRLGYDIRNMKMAVACVAMVDAATSGVIYSTSLEGDRDTMVINSVWGLGTSLVEGQTDADFYRVKKSEPFEIVETRTGVKDSMVALLPDGGVATVATPAEKRADRVFRPGRLRNLPAWRFASTTTSGDRRTSSGRSTERENFHPSVPAAQDARGTVPLHHHGPGCAGYAGNRAGTRSCRAKGRGRGQGLYSQERTRPERDARAGPFSLHAATRPTLSA